MERDLCDEEKWRQGISQGFKIKLSWKEISYSFIIYNNLSRVLEGLFVL